MTTKATIVCSFLGENDSGTAHAIAELDDTLNIDSSGNTKTSFIPGDTVYFLVQHDSRVQVQSIKSTYGDVSSLGSVERERSSFMAFVDTETEYSFGYIGGNFSTDWDGNEATITAVGDTKIQATGGDIPANGDITRTCTFDLYELSADVPDEDFKITVVVYFGDV